MSVAVTINSAHRIGAGTDHAILLLDVTVGTSHQVIPFDEAHLLRLEDQQAQIDYVVQAAVSAAAVGPTGQALPAGLEHLQTTTMASGRVPMAGFGVAQRTVAVDTAFTTNDYAVWFDATSGNRVGTLPTAVGNGGQQYQAKKADASTHTVTLTPFGAEKIDGANSLMLSVPGQSVTLTSDNAGWQIS